MTALSPSTSTNPASASAQSRSALGGVFQAVAGFAGVLETAIAAMHAYERYSRLSADELKTLGFEHGDASRAVFDRYIR